MSPGPPPPDTTAPATLLLVRHGSTGWTHGKRACGGDAPGPELSEEGVAQVRRLARLLRDGALAPARPPVAVISSPLVRARQTADLLAEPLCVPVAEDEGWAELRFGHWHGLTYAEIADRWAPHLQAWRQSAAAAPPGGESLDGLAARVEAARERLIARYPGQTVLVVTHVGPVRAVVTAALDAGQAAYWRLRVSPASLTVVRCWADGGCEVAAVNLGDALGTGPA